MTMRTWRAVLGSSAIVLLAGCGGDAVVTPDVRAVQPMASAAKNERTLAIELTTPSSNDGGMIFTIDGPNIVDVAPAPGFEVVANRVESHGRTTIDVLIVGPLHAGVIAWLTVTGVNSGHPYDATVTDVAAGAADHFVERRDLSAYRLVVGR